LKNLFPAKISLGYFS